MKKEVLAKNKKWLWLAIAIVAVLAVAGVLLAVFVFGNNEDTDATPTSKLYWNVDRVKFTENSETGLTTREPGEDGLYHIRVVTGGELLEVVASDGRLINYIDTLDAMGLVFDADGMVIDALDPNDFNPEIVRDFFVKRVTDTSITINSSIAMNGMDMTIDLTNAGVYDVTDSAAQPGMPAVCGLMDRVYVYGDMDGNPTDVFVVERADSAEVYWPLPGYWNSTKKETTRKPDENGVYTITFAYKGELVDLKCKDKKIVNAIDNTGNVDRCQALKFDEEGYIIGTISTQMALKAMRICDRYDVDTLEDGTFTATGHFGSTSGKEATSTLRDDCEVYLVCDNGTVESHIGEKTELQKGDRILCYSDLEGNAKLIYVLNRRVDSPLYFNVYKKSISQANGNTLRKVDDDGYYVFKLAVDGQMKTYRTKDVKLATFLDKQDNQGVGLKLQGDIIVGVYEQESVTGQMVAGIGRYIVGQTGMIVSAALARDINAPANLVMTPDCKIYNVTTNRDGTKIASETTLRMYDQVTMFRNYTGVTHIFVTRRYVEDAKLYWNTEAKLNAPYYTETTRTPNKEGYYVYTLACDGKQVTVKTKDKDMATYIDSANGKRVALKTTVDPNNKDHQIVKYAYNALSLIKAGYTTSDSYYYDYYNKDENRHYVYYKKDGEKVVGGTKVIGQNNLKTYNISDGYELVKGEKTTVRKDDKVIYLVSQIDWVAHYAFVTERKIDGTLAYNKTRMYNSTTKQTTRTPDAEGYYVFELAVNGEVKLYKTKDKAIASKLDSISSAFNLKAQGDIILGVYAAKTKKGISGLSVGRFDVTSINGNKVSFTRNRPTSSNLGATMEKTLAKNCEVYDMSPYAAVWGGKVNLKPGDRVEAYANDDGELCYINIIYACTREAGPVSYCDHCNKEVWWEPYVGEKYNVSDIHYYFPGNSTSLSKFTIGSDIKPNVKCSPSGKISNYITAYNGVVFEGQVQGVAVSIEDTNPVAANANAQTFPTDGSSVDAMCYVCNEVVTWKAFTKDCVWHKMYNANYSGETDAAWHSHFYVPNDITVTRTDKALITNALAGSASAKSTMCIHLNGKTITSPGEIRVEKSIINIMGNGTIDFIGTAAADVANATININNSSAKLNLYGGTYKNSSVRVEASFVFDMNGKKISNDWRIAEVNSKLDILDSAGGGSMVVTNGKGAYGGLISVNKGGVLNLHSGTLAMESAEQASNGGIIYVGRGGTLNILGGTITGGQANNGGNISVQGTVNLVNGTVSGGTATAVTDSNGKSTGGNGGNIQAYMGGVVNVTGGTITGGNASSAGNVYIGESTFNMTNGTVSNGTATNSGGNFRVVDSGVVNISGGTVTGGTAKSGGNFSMQATKDKKGADGKQVYATVNLTGGTVSNGTATNSGGNFYTSPYSKLNHTGGTISGGAATKGSAIAVTESITTRLVLGSTITGGDVLIAKDGTTTLTGKVNIDNLIVEDSVKVTLDNLVDGAKINVNATGAFTKANEKAADYMQYFYAVDPLKFIQVKENVLYCDVTPTECPICHEVTNWRKISASGNRISATLGVKHWIVDQDTVYDGDIANAVIYSNTAGFTMCINMNGKNLTSHNGIQASNGTINLFGGGTFVNTSESTSSSIGVTAMYVNTNAVVNLYDGVVIKSADPADSAVLFAGTAPTVNLYNGATLDGDVISKAGNPTLNVNGGIVTGAVKLTQGTTVLDGAANVASIETGLQGVLRVKETFTGTAVVDFPVYEAIAEEPGFAYAYTFNATVDGAFTGTLLNSEGKQFVPVATDVGGETVYRLKIETTNTRLVGNDLALAAETLVFPTGVDNNTEVTAFCPACNKVVIWKAIKGNNQRILMNRYKNAHLYMSEDMKKTNVNTSGDYAIFAASHTEGGEHTTACLHFNGKTYTANSEIQIDTGTVTAKGMTLSLMGKGKFVTDLSTTNTSFNRSIIRVGSTSAASSFNVYGVTFETTNKTKPAITYYAATSGANAGVNGCALNLYGNTTFVMPADSTADFIGSNIQYIFNDYRYTLKDGVLTVIGEKATEQPTWLASKDEITNIVIDENVKVVADNAFADCVNVTNVVMTNKLTTIGNDAFAGCTGIVKAEYFGEETEWAAITIGTGNEALTSKVVCHVHNYTSVVTAPTCEEKGFTTYTCACGDSYIADEVAASGHGAMTADYKCSVCNEVVDVTSYANAMTFPEDGTDSEQLCPHCNEVVVWKAAPLNALIKNDYAHYYLPDNTTRSEDGPMVQVNSTNGPSIQTLCLHLNGKTMTSKGGIVAISRNLNLMGNGGLVSSSDSTGGWGAFGIRMWGNGTINVYGGTYETGNVNSVQFREVSATGAAYINVYGTTTFIRNGSIAEMGYSGTVCVQANCHYNDYR